MCELFAVSALRKVRLNGLLEEFFSHGKDHPHGWGMAFLDPHGAAVEKEPSPSHKSSYLRHRLTAPILSSTLIAHIRLATKGSLEYRNTHPFTRQDKTGRMWTLAHNGTIFECAALNRYALLQEGGTDSERILMYIVDKINEAEAQKALRFVTAPLSHGSDAPPQSAELTSEECFCVVESVIHEITSENKVNILLFDGELLYAHTNYRASLHFAMQDGTTYISTRPLSTLHWQEFPLNTLLAFRDGQIVYTGRAHKNEFFDNEEKMRLLFIDYSSL